MRRLFLATLSVLALSGGARAADLPFKSPRAQAAAPATGWTGFYVGGDVGGLWNRQDVNWDPLPNPFDFGKNAVVGRLTASSFVGGVHGGYNWQLAPTWVLGIEADASWTGASSRASSGWFEALDGQPVPNSSTTLESKLDWLASARGRIGYLVQPNVLVYFTGGAAWGHVDYSASASHTTTGYLAATSFSKTESGYVLGGGLEWALTKNWLVRGEYLVYRLKGASAVAAAPNFANNPSSFTWSDPNIHVARLGLSYKFD